MRHSSLLLAALSALLLNSLNAQAAKDEHAGHAGHAMPAAVAMSVEPTEATVKKIDPTAGKITLSHGPLKNLGMPPMTMTFKAADPKVLVSLKTGDKIRFVAEMAGNDYLATRIEKAK